MSEIDSTVLGEVSSGLRVVDGFFYYVKPNLDVDGDGNISRNDIHTFSSYHFPKWKGEMIDEMFNEIDINQDDVLDEFECLQGTYIVPFKVHRNQFIELLKKAAPPTISLFKYAESGKRLASSLRTSVSSKASAAQGTGLRDSYERTFNAKHSSPDQMGNHSIRHIGFAQKRLFDSVIKESPSRDKSKEGNNHKIVPGEGVAAMRSSTPLFGMRDQMDGNAASPRLPSAAHSRSYSPTILSFDDESTFGTTKRSLTNKKSPSHLSGTSPQSTFGKYQYSVPSAATTANSATRPAGTQRSSKLRVSSFSFSPVPSSATALPSARISSAPSIQTRATPFSPAPPLVLRDNAASVEAATSILHNGEPFRTRFKPSTVYDIKKAALKDADHTPAEPFQFRPDLDAFFPTDEDIRRGKQSARQSPLIAPSSSFSSPHSPLYPLTASPPDPSPLTSTFGGTRPAFTTRLHQNSGYFSVPASDEDVLAERKREEERKEEERRRRRERWMKEREVRRKERVNEGFDFDFGEEEDESEGERVGNISMKESDNLGSTFKSNSQMRGEKGEGEGEEDFNKTVLPPPSYPSQTFGKTAISSYIGVSAAKERSYLPRNDEKSVFSSSSSASSDILTSNTSHIKPSPSSSFSYTTTHHPSAPGNTTSFGSFLSRTHSDQHSFEEPSPTSPNAIERYLDGWQPRTTPVAADYVYAGVNVPALEVKGGVGAMAEEEEAERKERKEREAFEERERGMPEEYVLGRGAGRQQLFGETGREADEAGSCVLNATSSTAAVGRREKLIPKVSPRLNELCTPRQKRAKYQTQTQTMAQTQLIGEAAQLSPASVTAHATSSSAYLSAQPSTQGSYYSPSVSSSLSSTELFFAPPKPKPKWISHFPPPHPDEQLASHTKHPLLGNEPFPSDSARLARLDRKARDLIVRVGAAPDQPEFKVAFRTLRPSDVFASLGEQIPIL
ncbi:uncharacterized protein MONOS_8247 [Monocercomonoides exilis]|uniref:uncharacterized protein n=1 Tax=Monocercomonoides exilis TaxID=2049356 RepID=UPI00355A5F21|nr:hypothetical protein MONOS_8247 [Monocercomonoides exilis]|eukprot:MONOS_8247.1-p1 / transcript=MONOS_8247.1 / gene=MONOS_8247 / organism=Monocercomonoides_exilis_PA203 / gene_product=unspecified product / transcript_product=unspecified product / location=Mono_scaffold00306:29323-32239(+) / protein_length=957 / sequence_SO=supercontig / SO=protein_coding / is_pseudo=false